jgi:transcriptional regulator with XRE-family HTH domain
VPRGPDTRPGGDLAAARERAGLTIEQAAQKTRIPQRYLEALERGDHAIFPPGPFLSGYTRQYRTFLGLPEAVAEAPARAPEPVIETTATVTTTAILRQSRRRLVAMGALVAVALALLGLIVHERFPPPAEQVGADPDQTVLVSVAEPVRVSVVSDGRMVFAGALAPGPQRKFEAHDRLQIDFATLDGVTLYYNGRLLKPLGAQSPKRRLVFIDDSAS